MDPDSGWAALGAELEASARGSAGGPQPRVDAGDESSWQEAWENLGKELDGVTSTSGHLPVAAPDKHERDVVQFTPKFEGACAHLRVINVYSPARDGNWTVLPNRREVQGYLIDGFGDTDGLAADVCLDCGRALLTTKIDLVKLNAAVEELESSKAGRLRR